MKGHRNNNDRYLVHQDSSLCDDHSSLVSDHRPALREMARGQSLVTQLRAIVLPALQADEHRELVAHIFESILDCSQKAMSELQAQPDSTRSAGDASVHCSKEEEVGKPYRQHKRRRFDDSVSLETHVPHYDGHQWRKYGQKDINNTKHPRSYYRCTYRQEQDCKATKTVQQQDDSKSSNGDHHEMYRVVYYGQHTCKGDVVDGKDGVAGETACTQSQSSGRCSISVTCSVADDHQTSLETELLDMPDLAAEVNQYDQLFDMAAYAPLDLGTWEMDERGHGFLKFGDR